MNPKFYFYWTFQFLERRTTGISLLVIELFLIEKMVHFFGAVFLNQSILFFRPLNQLFIFTIKSRQTRSKRDDIMSAAGHLGIHWVLLKDAFVDSNKILFLRGSHIMIRR